MTSSAVLARRPRLSAASRRRQLLDVALLTFARTGLDATTMDDIAREAGVTKPLLYQHFKSKRALFLELLDDVVVQIISALTMAAELLDGTLPYDPELAEAMRRVDDTIAGALRPLIQADIDPEHQRVLAAAVVGIAKGVTRDWLHSHSERSSSGSLDADAELLARRVAEFAWAGLRLVHRD